MTNEFREDSGLQWAGSNTTDSDKYAASPVSEKILQYPGCADNYGPKSLSGTMPRRQISSTSSSDSYISNEKFYAGGAPAPLPPQYIAHSPNPRVNPYNQTAGAPPYPGGPAGYSVGAGGGGGTAGYNGGQDPYSSTRRICGLRRRTFLIVLGVSVLAIVGIIVGAVAGTVVAHKAPPTPPTNDADTDPTPTAASEAAVTTTQIVLPNQTLLSDCPSANNTLYSLQLNGKTITYRRLCGVSLANPTDPKSPMTTSAISLEDCIDKCAIFNNPGETPTCNTVCWKNQKADAAAGSPGACFGYLGRNNTESNPPSVLGNFSGTTNCDSGFWINQLS